MDRILIPPADGLTENEYGLLCNIAQALQDHGSDGDGSVYYTFLQKSLFKSLCEFGVIGIATVTHHPWQNSYDKKYCQDGYKVWITDKGHQFMRGEINVYKPCTLTNKYSSYGTICKRHKKKHTLEEFEERRKKIL